MRSSKTIRIVLAWMLGVSAIFGADKGSKVVPKDASNVIRATADSADKREFPALRALMVDAFTWSFGDDENASQAIASTRIRNAERNSPPGSTRRSPRPLVSALVGAVIGSIAT